MTKNILVVNGSRNKEGNTTYFVNYILNSLTEEEYIIEWLYPQDYTIFPTYNSFQNTYTEKQDDIYIIKEKILSSDLLIIASPVYVHTMTADLKLIIERLSTWTHTLMLSGKPTIILSTCESNGFDKVIRPVSEIFTFMGGNIIAISNASLMNELSNDDSLNEIAQNISSRIKKYINIPNESNQFLERNFKAMKSIMIERIKFKKENDKSFDSEESHWINTDMINKTTFNEYISEFN